MLINDLTIKSVALTSKHGIKAKRLKINVLLIFVIDIPPHYKAK
jgi:hypothetical protein